MKQVTPIRQAWSEKQMTPRSNRPKGSIIGNYATVA
jgi:hypothetical protein